MSPIPLPAIAAASLLVKITLLLAAAALVHVAIRHRVSAATRHLLWTLAIAGALLLPALSVMLPTWAVRIRVPQAIAAAATPAPGPIAHVEIDPRPNAQAGILAAPPRETRATPTQTAAVDINATRADNAGRDVVAPRGRVAAGDLDAESRDVQIGVGAIAMVVYAVGALLLLARLAVQRIAIARIARAAVPVDDAEWRMRFAECARSLGVERPVRLLRSRDRTMPMAFGTRVPTIVIPAIADTWSDDRQRAVLLHELAHVARADCLTQMLATIACALYWPHPGVWLVARQLRVERELACDDRVLTVGTQPRDYAGHLLEIAYSLGGGRAPALVVSMARPRQLEGRMLALLDDSRNRAIPTPRRRLVALAITAALLLPLAGAEAVVSVSAAGLGSDDEATAAATAAGAARAAASPASPRSSAATRIDASTASSSRSSRSSDAARSTTTDADDSDVEQSPNPQDRLPGTWEVRPASESGYVQLQMREASKDGHNWSTGTRVPVARLEGLSAAQLAGTGGSANVPVTFTLRRDAGTFTFRGLFQNGVGAGTYDYTANPNFPAELAKRGIARPTAAEQYDMARHDVGLDLIDELAKQGYQRAALGDLIRAGQHGVRFEYVHDMGELGYKLGLIDTLIKLRDHGVSAQYIRDLANDGFTHISPEDLLKLRDHGVNAEYLRAMRDAGYRSISLGDAVRARDHGVNAEFLKKLSEFGYTKLSLDEVINARDHGISAEYVSGMREHGYTTTLPDMINARDHGVGVEYIRDMAALGYAKLPLDTLIKARDHGISSDYARDMGAAGYPKLSLDALIRARDHGVSPQYARELKDLGYGTIELDELIDLRNHGVSAERIRKANSRAGTKLPLSMIRALADGGDLR